MNISRISPTGQTTIPIEIRNFLHIKKDYFIKLYYSKVTGVYLLKISNFI